MTGKDFHKWLIMKEVNQDDDNTEPGGKDDLQINE